MDLVGAGVTAGCMALSAGAAWIIKQTRTSKDVESVTTGLMNLRDNHEKRLDGHDDDLRRIESEFVSRRELDEKLKLWFDPMQRQLEQHTRLLEFAVFGKMPEPPSPTKS